MTPSPLSRKTLLILHALVSVGLLGSILSFLAMACVALLTASEPVKVSLYPAMALVTLLVIVPLALAANLTGVISSLTTAWGLFRHRWVTTKLVITAVATLILLIKLRLILRMGDCYAGSSCLIEDRWHGGLELAAHAAAGFVILFVPLVLSIFKPKGLTAYGARKMASIE